MVQHCDANENDSRDNGSLLRAVETMRSIHDPAAAHVKSAPRGEDRVSLFWRIFGGTLLSIVALVVITVYQQFTSSLTELRTNLNHVIENRAELVRADDFNNRVASMWTTIKQLQDANATVTALKERSSLQEQCMKEGIQERKDLLNEIQVLRERVAVLEGKQSSAGAKAEARVK
jgi:hypothetical protein